ncbi:MAG: response regulator transcription factor [Planctomycetota bacterium]
MPTPRILIADSDTKLLPLLALHLRNEEYEVTCAEDGDKALELARRERPDLLLFDVRLPAGDGLSVHDRLAEFPDLAAIPIVFLVPERSNPGALQLPASVMIQKPVATSELLEKVSAVLGQAGTVAADDASAQAA